MEQKINCITKLKTLYPQMTDSEKKIADYVLNHPEEIYKLNIHDLAKLNKVSLPTVFRFTQTLGFEGFKEFKIELIKDMAVGLNMSVENTDYSSTESITRNIFEQDINNLKETLNLIDYENLEKAVNIIINSRRILFFAVSASLSVAFDAYNKFLRAGFISYYVSDSYSQRIYSTQCNSDDVAIGISFSGESIEVVECLKNARGNNAKTICVTTFMKSSITNYADISLLTVPVKYQYQKIDIPSRMSQHALLDALYLNVILKMGKSTVKFISKSEEELSKKIKKED
ncbi:MurR/RpiR family transcriptional regulator [bacterium]|nr:MurR/RpiR family transcriptional regulator [bacterium]